jgi:Uma2 family endonuclease
MVAQAKHMTVEDFDQFVEQPENADKLFEFIRGEITEVPSNLFASLISSRILGFIFIYLLTHDIGYVSGEAGGYWVSGERYAPDVGFISKAKDPIARHGYNPNPPDLAVEVDYPSSDISRETLRVKLSNYLAAGTVVWWVAVERKEVEVYIPGQPAKIFHIEDMLDGGDVLPGFKLAVKDIFPEQPTKDE